MPRYIHNYGTSRGAGGVLLFPILDTKEMINEFTGTVEYVGLGGMCPPNIFKIIKS